MVDIYLKFLLFAFKRQKQCSLGKSTGFSSQRSGFNPGCWPVVMAMAIATIKSDRVVVRQVYQGSFTSTYPTFLPNTEVNNSAPVQAVCTDVYTGFSLGF